METHNEIDWEKIILISLLIIISIIFAIGFKSCENEVDSYNEKMRSYVGKKICYDKDTLSVVHYDGHNFTLSNGAIIKYYVIENFKVINVGN